MRKAIGRLRTWGGIAGAAAAIGGGAVAAVGLYALPDPAATSVGTHVYAGVSQYAFAVLRQSQPGGGSLQTSFQIARGGSGFAHVPESPYYPPPYADASAYFHADRAVCSENDECEEIQSWNEAIPLEAFDFDPLLERARFAGTVEGCTFDVQWTGTGVIAPFAGASPQARTDWYPDLQLIGHAELSRVAPANAQTCFGSFGGVPGFLAQGLGRTEDHLHVQQIEQE